MTLFEIIEKKIKFFETILLNSISIVNEYKDCNNESNKNKIDKLNKLNNELLLCTDPDKSNFLYKKILDLFDRLTAGIFSPLFNEATHKASMLEKKERIEQINRLGIANKLLLLQDQFEKIILLIEKDLPDEDGLRNLFMQNYLLINIELKTTPFKTTDLKENDDVKIPTKTEKPALSHGFFSLFSKETPAAQPTALQSPVKNQTSPLEAHRKDVFKLCSDFLLHEKQKTKTDKDAEQRAINKTKLLNELIKFLDENKFHDFDNFSAAYKKNKENLRQPTRFIGSSQGEKFTNAVDKILDSIKAEQPTMLSHKKT